MMKRPHAQKLALRAVREVEVALRCACATVAGVDDTRALPGESIDWDVLARFATRHGILPLVYEFLSSRLGDAVQGQSARGILRRFQSNTIRNRFLARELVRLTASFEQSRIRTIAFKGPALAVSAYGSVNMRQFVDLDLLVHQEQVAEAIRVLLEEGYVAPSGYGTREIARRGAFETSMVKPGTGVAIDLHWRLAEPYFPLSMDREDLWRRAMRIEIENGAVSTLDFEDHLLYLCVHGARHGWEALGGVCDVARLIRVAPIDWDRVCARSERVGARRMLLLGVLLAHDLIDAEVPERLLDAAWRERGVIAAARAFIRYAADTGADGPGLYQRWSIPLRMIERPRARIRYLASRALFPSADDCGLVNLPPVLMPLYYLVRPLRIVLKESRAAIRGLRAYDAPSADRPMRPRDQNLSGERLPVRPE